MENEHYKRNDSILYLLVVVSICLSVVSIVMQFNLRSEVSQAARLNLAPVNEGYINIPNPTLSGECEKLKADIAYAQNEIRENIGDPGLVDYVAEWRVELTRLQNAYYGACVAKL